MRVLACGGDGTVGWVLSILDQIGASPAPAVGVLPLGTGNDLARALGWGGGYKDEPIGKILTSISDSETTLLDRWQLKVERNSDAKNDDDGGKGKENLPLNVVNNYFSLGVDAHIALEFHEARGETRFQILTRAESTKSLCCLSSDLLILLIISFNYLVQSIL